MSTSSCGWERLAVLLAEPNAKALILDYWLELSPLPDELPLDPDFAEMIRLEGEGRFAVWALRVDGALAGFLAWHLMRHLNYRSVPLAMDAAHYLAPRFRDKGRLGLKMWRSALAALKARGVRVVIAHDNSDRPLLPFFLALGLEPRSTHFWGVL